MEHVHPEIRFRAVGVVRSPHRAPSGTPIQPAYAADIEGEVIVDPTYAKALQDIEGFERIWLIYLLDRAHGFEARVIPYRDTQQRGLFATRSPSRPNPIGMSAVRLLGRRENVLRISGVDILDNTPLLDIKPYVPSFDAFPNAAAGWFDTCGTDRKTADDRFHKREES